MPEGGDGTENEGSDLKDAEGSDSRIFDF